MHRQRTQFSRRVNRVFTHRADRVAKAVERRGIRATYELHDRVLSNRKSRAAVRGRPSRSSTTCSGGSSPTSRRSGFSVASFDELFPDDEHWSELEAMRDRFVAETEADLAKGGEHVRVRAGKEFVVRLHSYGAELGLDDPWFRAVASRRLLDIANAYLEMWSKLEYVDVWYSVPQPAEARAHLVAALASRLQRQAPAEGRSSTSSTSTSTMGPFQYVPGSQPGGPYADAWPWEPLGTELPDGGGARGPHPGLVDPRVHRSEGDAHLLQHGGLPSRRLLDDEPARARDGHLLVSRLARLADGAELRLRGRRSTSSTSRRGSRSPDGSRTTPRTREQIRVPLTSVLE